MSIRQVSASAFADYLICPSLYYYKYLDNFDELLFGPTEESLNGDIIHKLIDNDLKGLPVSEDFIRSNRKVKTCWDNYRKNYLPESATQEIYSEWTFNLPVNSLMEKVMLNGRINCFILENDKITIFAWKSGERLSPGEAFIHRKKLEFYAYALSTMKNIENIELKTVNLSLSEETSITINKNALKEIEQKLFDMLKKTHPEIRIYIPEPLSFESISACDSCHFYSLCEDFL